MAAKKVLVAGGSGVVGYAAVKRFASSGEGEAIALSRRPPAQTFGAAFVPLDLSDAGACAAFAESHGDVTHLVYAAVHEQDSLIDGWRDDAQIDANDRMFRNLIDPLARSAKGLRHVTLMQGTKAYGVHVRKLANPAREGRSEMRAQPNFYWRQEDHLKAAAEGKPWAWTILRPVHIFGEAIGSSLNTIAAIGVYAAILKEEGRPLDFPGGAPRVSQAIDADILADAIAWAGESAAARNQTFNVANGDVFTWENVWPAIADALGMAPGAHAPLSLSAEMPKKAAVWDRVRRKHGLAAPDLDAFVRTSFQLTDYSFRYGLSEPETALVSTVKLHNAGFHREIDTEDMFRKWFRLFQERKLLPNPAA